MRFTRRRGTRLARFGQARGGAAGGGPPPPADVFFDLQSAAAPTNTGGTQDFTASGFGTPAAVLNAFFNTATLGNISADASAALGFSDGSAHSCRMTLSEDAVSPSNTSHKSDNAFAQRLYIPSTTLAQAQTAMTNITNGCQYNWTLSSLTADLFQANLMFGGSNLQAAVGVSSGTRPNGAAFGVTTGFEPDLIIIATGPIAATANAAPDGYLSLGFCDNALNQGCVSNLDWDALGSSTGYHLVDNTRVAAIYDRAQFVNENLEVTAVGATSFTLRYQSQTTTSWTGAIHWLALKGVASSDFKVGFFDSPIATGLHTVSGAGFRPRLVIQLLSGLTAYSPFIVTDDAFMGVSLLTDALQVSGGYNSGTGQNPAQAKSAMANKAVFYPDHASAVTPLWEGDFGSFNGDGYAIDYTQLPGGISTPTKGIYAAFR